MENKRSGAQIYWISWSILLNEEQFDKNVYAAVNRVSDKLEYYEVADVLEAIDEILGPGEVADGLRGTPVIVTGKTANHGFLQVQ